MSFIPQLAWFRVAKGGIHDAYVRNCPSLFLLQGPLPLHGVMASALLEFLRARLA
jgi:hypothetical protein